MANDTTPQQFTSQRIKGRDYRLFFTSISLCSFVTRHYLSRFVEINELPWDFARLPGTVSARDRNSRTVSYTVVPGVYHCTISLQIVPARPRGINISKSTKPILVTLFHACNMLVHQNKLSYDLRMKSVLLLTCMYLALVVRYVCIYVNLRFANHL